MREVLQTELQQEQREKSSPNSKIPHTKRKTLLDMTLCAVCAALAFFSAMQIPPIQFFPRPL